MIPRLPITLPCARDADHAAYIINRAMIADDNCIFNDAFYDAIADGESANPAIHDLILMLMTNNAIFTETLLSFDLCPIHECDIEICIDDNDSSCADLRN